MSIILKEIRRRHNLTQTEFAEKVNVSRSAIAQIESGKNNISLDLAKKISEVFSISISSILDSNNKEGIFEIYTDAENPNAIWNSYYGEMTIIQLNLDKIEMLKLLISKVAKDKKLKGITPNFDKFCKKYDFEKTKNEFEEKEEKDINQKKIDSMHKLIDTGIRSLFDDLYNNLSVGYDIMSEYYKS